MTKGPRQLGWWVGVLFMIGSFCFAIASVPGFQSVVATSIVGVVYFVGSIFFTSAASLQLVQSVASGPLSLDWWAGGVQLVGTLWFNLNTWDAMQSGLDTHEENLRVFTPDFVGSICFLVASLLAIRYLYGSRWWARAHDDPWSIVTLNMVGSIFFMAAACAAFVRPSTGELLDASLANSGTLLGAICFFWAAGLSLRVAD